jgi:hypothetical protein
MVRTTYGDFGGSVKNVDKSDWFWLVAGLEGGSPVRSEGNSPNDVEILVALGFEIGRLDDGVTARADSRTRENRGEDGSSPRFQYDQTNDGDEPSPPRLLNPP